MIEALSKKSGVTHKGFIDSKTVNIDQQKIWMRNESQITYHVQTSEVPVIKTNDLKMLAEQNSIVFRAAEPPVWNRNQTFLPMAYQLYADTIVHPGHDYTLQTIPTQSEAIHFNVKNNQPDFQAMFDKRLRQAMCVETARETYKAVYGYTDEQISRIDEDLYADEIMSIISVMLKEQIPLEDDCEQPLSSGYEQAYEDTEVFAQMEAARKQFEKTQNNTRRFAGHTISADELFHLDSKTGAHELDAAIIHSFWQCRTQLAMDKEHFLLKNRSLYNASGDLCFIRYVGGDKCLFDRAARDPKSRVYAESQIAGNDILDLYEVTDDFYAFLSKQQAWDFADGAFEKQMKKFV